MAGDITRRDWGFTFSSAIPTPSAIVPYDDRPISDGQMIAIHIYVFGGLAFFVGTVVSALVWRPGFRIEPYQDIENWEKAYEANVKRRQEKKKAREEHTARARERQRIALSAANRDSQRVGWASSIATLQGDETSSKEKSGSLKAQWKEKSSVASSKNDFFARPSSELKPKSILIKSEAASHVEPPRPSFETITPIPKAYTELPRNQVHIEPNANIGEEMIATTGPGEAESWSGPNCTCGAALDDVDALIRKAMCEVHRFN
ncbi:hypothetical protein MD484_g2162, partial [Candolleomyces efflorescens]